MRILLVLVTCALLVSLGCGKSPFDTTPRLEVKSISSEEIHSGETLQVVLEYFDKEGDLSECVLTYIRIRTNVTPIPNPTANDKPDTIRVTLPEFPAKTQGEIVQSIAYDFMNENDDPNTPGKNDTMYFKFTVMDKEGNKSDTVTTKLVTAIQP